MMPHDRWLNARISQLEASQFTPRAIGRIVSFDRISLAATGIDAPLGALLLVGDDKNGIPVEAMGVSGDRLMLTPLGRADRVEIGQPVHRLDGGEYTPSGSCLLGRSLDALGEPIDGLAAVDAPPCWPLSGQGRAARARGRVVERLETGVRAIDGLLTLGRGQRLIIAAAAGVGKSVLLHQIMAGCQADAIVVALVGERGREIADFRERAFSGERAGRTILVASAADLAPQLRLRAVMRATAIAESMAAEGKHVLLLVDSLTRVCHAQREIGLAMGEPPTRQGYPPSAMAIIPTLLERAGVDAVSGGSITALYTTLMEGDDRDDPVVDSARSIADGHILLSRDLAEQGVFPAIDIGRSLSRLMDDLVDAEHRNAAMHLRRTWSLHAANQDLLMIGAYVPGSNPSLDRAVALHPAMLDFLRQAMDRRVPFDTAVLELRQLLAGGA